MNLLKKQHLHPKDIGYKRALTIESIVAQSPNTVIADSSSGPASVIDRLPSFNIKVIRLDHVTNERDVKENINKVAKVQRIINGNPQPKVLVLLQISANGAYLLGQETQANQWLKLLHAKIIY